MAKEDTEENKIEEVKNADIEVKDQKEKVHKEPPKKLTKIKEFKDKNAIIESRIPIKQELK